MLQLSQAKRGGNRTLGKLSIITLLSICATLIHQTAVLGAACGTDRYPDGLERVPLVQAGSFADCLDPQDVLDVFAIQLNQGSSIKLKLTGPSNADFDLYLVPPQVEGPDDVWASTLSRSDEWIQVDHIPLTGEYLIAVHNYSGGFGYWQVDIDIFQPVNASGRTQVLAEMQALIDFVTGDLNQFWNQIFAAYGQQFIAPTGLVVYNANQSAAEVCGFSAVTVGENALFCSLNGSVYYDVNLFHRVYANIGDMAIVVILAHEWGHAAQWQVGLLGDNRVPRIRLELQADCLAGVYTRHAAEEGLLEEGDLQEALYLLSLSGDPVHGDSSQRISAFRQGLTNGVDGCSM